MFERGIPRFSHLRGVREGLMGRDSSPGVVEGLSNFSEWWRVRESGRDGSQEDARFSPSTDIPDLWI